MKKCKNCRKEYSEDGLCTKCRESLQAIIDKAKAEIPTKRCFVCDRMKKELPVKVDVDGSFGDVCSLMCKLRVHYEMDDDEGIDETLVDWLMEREAHKNVFLARAVIKDSILDFPDLFKKEIEEIKNV